MKTDQLKVLVKEITKQTLREGKIQDPDKSEMMSYLQQQYGNEEGWKDDAEVAIYWFANFYHGGQWSNLYSVLSTSPFSPGPIARGPQKGSMEEMMYRDLVHQFAGGEGLDDEDDDAFHQTDEMIGSQLPKKHPMDDYDPKLISAVAEKFQKEIDQLKTTHPNISFGYIGNVWNDARYQPQDDRAWYVWNGRAKFGGYATKELPEMWKKWEAGKERFLQQPIRETMGNEGRKYTVRFVVLGREPTEETFDDKEVAIRAARDFIRSVVTPGAKKAGEYIEAVKNGYIVRQAAGNTVAAAIIQGAGTIFQEVYMPSPEGIVEYVKPLPGAKPFVLNTAHEGPQKFELCVGKLPNGKNGLAVYAYRGDFAITVEHFNDVYGSLL